jgi:hypothetical protein
MGVGEGMGVGDGTGVSVGVEVGGSVESGVEVAGRVGVCDGGASFPPVQDETSMKISIMMIRPVTRFFFVTERSLPSWIEWNTYLAKLKIHPEMIFQSGYPHQVSVIHPSQKCIPKPSITEPV